MNLYHKSLCLVLYSLQCITAQIPPRKINVAVIGAGASGTSLSYYLSQFADANKIELNIDLFEESSRIGGRVHEVGMKGKSYELGAESFIKDNFLIADAVKKFSLEIQENTSSGSSGFYDGEKMVEYYDGNGYFNNIKFYLKYLIPHLKTKTFCNKLKGLYEEIYNKTYSSIREFVTLTGLEQYTKTTAYSYWLENITDNKDYIKIVLNSIVRGIYSTDVTQVHPLAACIAFLGATSKSYSIKDGNHKIFEEFINYSNAMISFHSKVTKISYITGLGYSLDVNERPYYSTYDAVFLATPLHKENFMQIKYENINYKTEIHREVKYTSVTSTIFKDSKIRQEYFNSKSNLDTIYGFKKNLPFSVIVESKDDGTVKMSQLSYIPYFQLKEMIKFDSYFSFYQQQWNAYPNMTPLGAEYLDVKHHTKLYYLGSLEPLLSTMESQVMNARNIAKLALTEWGFIV